MNKLEIAKNSIDEMVKKLDKEISTSIGAFTLSAMFVVQTSASNEVEANMLADYMFEKIIKMLDEYKELTVKALNEK